MGYSELQNELMDHVKAKSIELSEEIATKLADVQTMLVKKDLNEAELSFTIENVMYTQGNINLEVMELRRYSWELSKVKIGVEGPTASMANLRSNLDSLQRSINDVVYSYQMAFTTLRDWVRYLAKILDEIRK